MRRIAIVTAFAAFLGLGLGCKFTSGKCDCNYDASNHPLPVTGMTYPTVGPSVGGPATAPAPTPAPIKEAK